MHFEGQHENIILIKQVILQCCTCLLGLNVLRLENSNNNQNNDLFQVCKRFLWFFERIFY